MAGMSEEPDSPSLRGQLLVATPPLSDPRFDRTVVLVLEHAPEHGAIGVVLNRPARTPVTEILPAWGPWAADPPVFFHGGPVAEASAVIGVGRATTPDPDGNGWRPVLGAVGAVDLDQDPAGFAPPLEVARLFSGYSGWSPAQLEAEIDAGGWFVCPAEPGDVFTDTPEDLWAAVLRRQGGKLAMYSMIPADPRVN